ncbi:MAG: AAA family ATPase [Oscillospiraceae bacterium]|nr:AAA family ATPase [Oscillospiraceae bacterium]
MRILSMTATFGKLSRQTLILEPGMNLIEAPNEWGKSTWCAFIMAMLYGIDTGARTKTGFLADKEHYAPWSGEPMSGRMDILWQGREITVERQNKGRIPMGEVKAYETHTGLPVPELCISAPGQVLLGVERSVFARSGFLRQSEMPVTEDESLRRRLNELVTTADESGASDALAQKLKDLKNHCRFNKKGLLPEQEARLAELEEKLAQLRALTEQATAIRERQQALEAQLRDLQNHKQALEYAAYLQYAEKLAAAQEARDSAVEALAQAEADCAGVPAPEKLQRALAAVQQLRDARDALHTKVQLLPPLPQAPVVTEPFRGKAPEAAIEDARIDRETLTQLGNERKKTIWYLAGGICALLGIIVLFILPVAGIPLLVAGAGLIPVGVLKQKKRKAQITQLIDSYRGIPADRWEAAAEEYAQTQRGYEEMVAYRQQELTEINLKLDENAQAIADLTGGEGLARFEEGCRLAQQKHSACAQRREAMKQTQEVLDALTGAGKTVEPPQFPDNLTWSARETAQLLSDGALEQQLLRQKLGQCQGQMETLGQAEHLEREKTQVHTRIAALELHHRALTRAQETLIQATQELQRRFAPRISQRAQGLFGRLTGQRYNRLSLLQDLSVEAGAEGENTLRGTLWRSDGTVDQLYLALRLAVAEVLTPEAPLILDDALVRFDDARMQAALEILREEAEKKQVILFTCQSRERTMEGTK